MTSCFVKLTALSAILIGVYSPANAQAPQVDTSQCAEKRAIIVDGNLECQHYQQETLDAIITDMEAFNKNRDPYSTEDGDGAGLRKLPDVSLEFQKAEQAHTRTLLMRVNALDKTALSNDVAFNAEILTFLLKQRLLLPKHDNARIPFTNDSGFYSLMSYLSRQTRFEKPSDYEAYAARLSELPRFFDQHMQNMRRGIRTEFTASDQVLPGIIEVIKTLGNGPIEDHSFFKPFLKFPASFSEADKTRLRALGEDAMRNKVLPAYATLESFFKTEYVPAARTRVGIGSVPGGRDYYRAAVKHFTTLDITPDEVHALGLSEVKRIRAKMETIIEETGFEGDFKDFLAFMRTDERFYAKTDKYLLKEAAYISKKIDGQMPKFFKTLPRLPYGVQPVPDEIAKNYTTGRYWLGNTNQGIAGYFMVNTYNLKERPLYNLPALAAHEGVPGHHHQFSIAQELENVPPFRRRFTPNAFSEGWGLYSEKLGEEMGIYTTPYEQFGRLTYEMWRACRLVVDTGMHWKGWTRAQAEACFFDNSALAPHNIRTEVERYISWPGQALAYKIGELKIIELREKAEQALGEDFDIREFHDQILGSGGIPLNILETKINNWISVQQHG